MRNVKISIKGALVGYSVEIGNGLLAHIGGWSRTCLGDGRVRVALVTNTTVFRLYGKPTSAALTSKGFDVSLIILRDGEKYKTLKTAERILEHLGTNGFTRTDAVLALGGGVVGDVAGFAAAIYQRGIAFLQVPTTLLSMIDSSVGGKTGVNSEFGKNTIGAFHQPRGVLIDPDVLSTLPSRELTAGFCEMIKHAAIGGRKLLKDTRIVLNEPQAIAGKRFNDLIAENIRLKARIVAEDEREVSSRADSRSRKVLNFGHTLAHALEKVTDYRYFKHGEAVGYGLRFAAELSKSVANLPQKDIDLLNDVVHRAGPLPSLANIDEREVLEAFRFDKKNLSGSLQMVLLKGIGKPVIVSERDIPRTNVKQALRKLLKAKA